MHWKKNLNLSEEAIDDVIKKFDSKEEGKINYSDFLAATMNFDTG